VDVFVVITDSETWAGAIHPSQALQEYRTRFNPKAKMIVVGMTSNGFTIADPADPLSLDVVGFDTSTPNVVAEFCREEEKD
jgi:60 kDa SS-A/Ro ribonucleoprotein